MLSINKQDIFKTVVIIWFIAATGYFIYDQYVDYRVYAVQASYQSGYTDAVNQLFSEAEKNQCQPFEVRNGDKKISLVNGECLQQGQSQPQATTPTK